MIQTVAADEVGTTERGSAMLAMVRGRLDRLLTAGFELQKDLTGRQPMSFDGGYHDWYSEALALVAQLLPERRAELEALYAPKRRRVDIETYGIRDYLLGLSLHGGYGPLDAMRAIAARRFHLQLMILRSAATTLAPGLHRLEAMAAAALTEAQLREADRLAARGEPAAGMACLTALLRVRLERIAQAASGRRPEAADMVALRLSREGVISAEQALLCRGALRHDQPGEPTATGYRALREATARIAMA